MKVTNLLTQADRDMFDRIDRDCIAMHVPTPPKTFLKLEVADSAGDTVQVYEDRAHSWVRNTYNSLAISLLSVILGGSTTIYGAGYLGQKSTNNIVSQSGFIPISGGAAGVDTTGIVIGTSNLAESFEHTDLQAQILNGSTSGKMTHADMVKTPTYDAETKKITVLISRVFNNNSGSPISVNEIGIKGTLSSKYFLLCRDLLATTVNVPNAGQLTVTYTIEMTFPA